MFFPLGNLRSSIFNCQLMITKMSYKMKTFEENLKSLPTAEKTVLLRLYNREDELVSILPNIPGRQGSVRVFKHIADKKGVIDFEAAKEGLRIFEEKVEDARKNPGKHQKLELLLGIKSRRILG